MSKFHTSLFIAVWIAMAFAGGWGFGRIHLRTEQSYAEMRAESYVYKTDRCRRRVASMGLQYLSYENWTCRGLVLQSMVTVCLYGYGCVALEEK